MTQEDQYKIKVLENRIANGELDAMYEYACLYQEFFPEYITPAIASQMTIYYTKCIEAGNLTAALNLGAMYYAGEIVPRNYKKAIELYEIATDSTEYETQVRAWCNLGYCYYYGRDISVDDERAFNCFMRAALMRDANSLYKIGDMYRYGRYVQKDESMAWEFYLKALHELGKDNPSYSDVYKRVGECVLYGIGVEKNSFLALKMLSQAEIGTYEKIRQKDPFAVSLLPKIQKMLNEARQQVEHELDMNK